MKTIEEVLHFCGFKEEENDMKAYYITGRDRYDVGFNAGYEKAMKDVQAMIKDESYVKVD